MRTRLNATLAFCLLAAGIAMPVAAQEVEVSNYLFKPAELQIRKGETVTWVNREKRVSHSVVFLGSGKESERFFPGESWSHTFDTPGRYEYTCGPHPEMRGVIVVED